jgi:hypothetical protein
MVLQEGQPKWVTADSILGIRLTETPESPAPATSSILMPGRIGCLALVGIAGIILLILGVGLAALVAHRNARGVPTSQSGSVPAAAEAPPNPELEMMGKRNLEPEQEEQQNLGPDENGKQKPTLEKEWQLRIEQEVEQQLNLERNWEWQPPLDTEQKSQKRQKDLQKRQYVERMLTYMVRTGEITFDDAQRWIREMETTGALIRK